MAAARSRIAHLLDEAERGETVVIERRGLRFEVSVRGRSKIAPPRESAFEYVDPAILDGAGWTWDWQPGRIQFRKRRPRA